jgi:HlyD family secretion protein
VLANIDPTLYQTQVDQDTAALAHAVADLKELEAKCAQTEQEWKRARKLKPQKAIADTDYDLDEANYLVAKANVEVGKATIQQCEATLQLSKTNLGYTVIKSPVRGIVIDRRVSVGQTVVAALSAPSIFLLAKDLRRMQIWASVNEADIGKILIGLPVRFTIDTYPGETFVGKVSQIRLNAQTTQNIVTYTVVVSTDNPPTADKPNGKLIPYMTANVKFEIQHHSNVLKVPNAALRWKPRPLQIAPEAREFGSAGPRNSGGEKKESIAQSSISGSGKTNPPGANPSDSSAAKKEQKEAKRLWVVDGDFVRPLLVQTGPTDDSTTEISGADVEEGMRVVIGESRSGGAADDSDTTNPFLPKLRPGGSQQKSK